MILDPVGEGMGVEHDCAQEFPAAACGLRYGCLEPGRQELHLANFINDYQIAFPDRLMQSGNADSVQSVRVHMVSADLVGARDAHVGQYGLLTVKGDDAEPLPHASGPYLLSVEAARPDFGPVQGLLDKGSLACARLTR